MVTLYRYGNGWVCYSIPLPCPVYTPAGIQSEVYCYLDTATHGVIDWGKNLLSILSATCRTQDDRIQSLTTWHNLCKKELSARV